MIDNKLLILSALDCLPVRKVQCLADLLGVTTRTLQTWSADTRGMRSSVKRLLVHELQALPGERVFIKDADGELVYALCRDNFLRWSDGCLHVMSIEKGKITRPVVRKLFIDLDQNREAIDVLSQWPSPLD